MPRGRGRPPKLSPNEVAEVVRRLIEGERVRAVAADYGVSGSMVRRVRATLAVGGRPCARSKLSLAEQAAVRRRRAEGSTVKALAAEFRVRPHIIYRLTSTLGGVYMRLKQQKPRSELRLSLEEREEISRGILAGESARAIAAKIHRAPSTVSREIQRAGGRARYRAWRAEVQFIRGSARPKERRLACNAGLLAMVEEGLANFWSPEQISAHLRREYPNDPSMTVSHETIYKALYVQGRGALRAELKKYLRWKRMQRQKRSESREDRRGKLKDMVLISDRPAEVEDRAVPGHWEGDLIIGRGGRSAIATLVERHSRYVMLAALPNGRTAVELKDALARLVKTLPEQLRKTLTWDQGKEMAQHVSFTVDSGVQVYFCNPHSPWQRGSNENTNGLLRQFLPRTTDLSQKTQEELNEIARLLNNRPRQTLNWMRPSEMFNRAVAMTG